MNEAEVLSALAELGSTIATWITAFFSFTFAYVISAYFAGATLSKLQCYLVTSLYLLTALVFGATTIGYMSSWLDFNIRHESSFSNDIVFGFDYWVAVGILLLVSSSLASVYFMYDVRRKARS